MLALNYFIFIHSFILIVACCKSLTVSICHFSTGISRCRQWDFKGETKWGDCNKHTHMWNNLSLKSMKFTLSVVCLSMAMENTLCPISMNFSSSPLGTLSCAKFYCVKVTWERSEQSVFRSLGIKINLRIWLYSCSTYCTSFQTLTLLLLLLEKILMYHFEIYLGYEWLWMDDLNTNEWACS